MSTPKFRNADGSLTLYALACGYIESTEGPLYGVRLWQDGCFHVRRHHNGRQLRGYIQDSWECFDSLTEARKFYKAEVRKIKSRTTA